jgi:hypothetical protein
LLFARRFLFLISFWLTWAVVETKIMSDTERQMRTENLAFNLMAYRASKLRLCRKDNA